MKYTLSGLLLLLLLQVCFSSKAQSWIRINQLGYPSNGNKVAVWCSKEAALPDSFQLVDAGSGKVVFKWTTGTAHGAYGPFAETARLAFTAYTKQGSYFLQCGGVVSPTFKISDDVYDGAADFSLRYLRQQRSGFNPFLKDSCHTGDGYTMYGPMPDSTHIDVAGGWHDATDYLQYLTTSANATYHLLAAYRDFPSVFGDQHAANGLTGSNGTADVLDEARWGLAWLLKMHPQKDWMFTQLADDRDHAGFRLPNHDSVDYGLGKGKGRPVYFATGRPQGLGKFKNNSTGVASAAGKFASAFALGAMIYKERDQTLSNQLAEKALSAYQLGIEKPGVAQTAPNREPYFYEEDNWVDDMELAAANLYRLTKDTTFLQQSIHYSTEEKVTPWMGADTARHYQWYPFHNFGHYELAGQADQHEKTLLISYYKEGIERVWRKAKQNAFYRGVPFIWCSNNLNVAFAIQCYLYRQMSGDKQYMPLEQACFDWLFGCNPWGKCMVYGLPLNGNTPQHPHSSLALLQNYDLDGAMVDGPIAGSIYNNLRGLKLYNADAYAEFQSDLAVYHDDAGDYSTNEPTTDGTASLVYLLAAQQAAARQQKPATNFQYDHGAIVRGSRHSKQIALVFTGDEFADGGPVIRNALLRSTVKGSFFLTGNFYRQKNNESLVKALRKDGHYMGAHSDKHLLYCDWTNRDSLLVTKKQFSDDLQNVYKEMARFGISKNEAPYFLPPYEWYNDTISAWTKEWGLQLVSFSGGTRSNADYTYPAMNNRYISSDSILQSIRGYERTSADGLNGFILLLHIGTDPLRTDKVYNRLTSLISELKKKGYRFCGIDELLRPGNTQRN